MAEKKHVRRKKELKKSNKRNFSDAYWRLSNLYTIVNKPWKSITFKPNEAQKLVLIHEAIQHKNKGRDRTIILKARQLGITTLKLIQGLDKALFIKNKTIVITAHKKEKQIELFRRVKYAFEQMPNTIILDDGTVWHKPKVKDDNKNELSFPENNSRIQVSLDCRSGTPTDVHITELAFRRDAKEMMTGTLPSIHKKANLTIETTANGMGNYFHSMWNKNYKQENAQFHTLFLPWYTDITYVSDDRLPVPPDVRHITNPDYMRLSLKQNQINWYAAQFLDLGEEVLQEFPSTPEEAFLASGDKFISDTFLRKLKRPGFDMDIEFENMRIYQKPDPAYNGQYIYGIDTAYGGKYWDYSVISVRKRDWKLVALYREKKDPEDLVDVIVRLIELGYWWLLWVERNNSGHVTIKHLELRGYSKFIHREETIDKETNKEVKRVGWLTDEKSRNVALNEFAVAIRTGDIEEVDDREWTELNSFIWVHKTSRRRPEADEWANDDTVLADAICWQMRHHRPIIMKRNRPITLSENYI